nr:MAG TPA: hypothetical protein [Caudoviricetes sp.]
MLVILIINYRYTSLILVYLFFYPKKQYPKRISQ